MPVQARIEPLRWESEFFHRPQARLIFDSLSPALTPAQLDAYALVQAKISAADCARMDALGALGFRPVLGEIDCCYTLAPSPVVSQRPLAASGTSDAERPDFTAPLPVAEMRLAVEADIGALRQLVAEALELSRFRAPWFSGEERRLFYAQWAENAVRGTFDDCCLVAQGADGLTGMVTLRALGEGEARIGILAVAPGLGGRGIGRLLCNAALAWCRQRQHTRLWVATQTANLPALRLYLASGAHVAHAACWLYRGPDDSF